MNNETQVNLQESLNQESVPNVTPPVARETIENDLPKGVKIFASLVDSCYKLALTTLIVTISAGLAIVTYKFACGLISSDIYLQLLQLFFDFLNNLIIV